MSGDNQSGTASMPASAFDQAAEWFARLQSEDSGSATKRRFRRWLRQSPDNVSAFRECQSMWDAVGDASSDPDILSMRNDALTAVQPETHDRWGRITAIAASLCALAISVTVLALVTRDTAPADASIERRVSRSPPQRRSTVPRPGSVRPSPARRIYRRTQHRLLMQVNYSNVAANWFSSREKPSSMSRKIRSDLRRQGRRQVVRAVGTEFAVRMDGDAVRVTLVEGVVDVGRTVEGRFLGGGEDAGKAGRGRADRTGRNRSGSKDAIDTQIATSWRDGRLVFDNDPLSPSSPRSIATRPQGGSGDPSLAEMRVAAASVPDRRMVSPKIFRRPFRSRFRPMRTEPPDLNWNN